MFVMKLHYSNSSKSFLFWTSPSKKQVISAVSLAEDEELFCLWLKKCFAPNIAALNLMKHEMFLKFG